MQYGSLSHNTSFNSLSLTYSVDMVRYNFMFDYSQAETMRPCCQYLYDYFSMRIETALYSSQRSFSYTNLMIFKSFNASGDSSVIKLGIGFNGPSKEDDRRCFLEFNPNKVDFDVIDFIIKNLHPFCMKHWLSLVRWDLAIDIPLKRCNVYMLKDRRDYCFFSSARKGVTSYLGQRSNDGFVKLYDKTKESKLDYDLTRLEITYGSDGVVTMPIVYLDLSSQEILPLDLSGTNRVLALLLNRLDEDDLQVYMNMLNYKLRKKLEPYLCKGFVLEYDFVLIQQMIHECNHIQDFLKAPEGFHNMAVSNIKSPFDK